MSQDPRGWFGFDPAGHPGDFFVFSGGRFERAPKVVVPCVGGPLHGEHREEVGETLLYDAPEPVAYHCADDDVTFEQGVVIVHTYRLMETVGGARERCYVWIGSARVTVEMDRYKGTLVA